MISVDRSFTLATINVQGISERQKFLSVVDALVYKNIDVAVLTETRLSCRTALARFRCPEALSSGFTFYDASLNFSPNFAGLLMVVKNDLARYVAKQISHEGRYLYIDMFLPGKLKFCFIGVYMSQFKNDPAANISLQQSLISLIDASLKVRLPSSHWVILTLVQINLIHYMTPTWQFPRNFVCYNTYYHIRSRTSI